MTSSEYVSLSELHIYKLGITISELITLYHCLQVQVRLARDPLEVSLPELEGHFNQIIKDVGQPKGKLEMVYI